MATGAKDPGAFKTIGELSSELGVAQHILRYWETKFPQLRPLQRAGNRRYYRPADVDLARTIHRLLNSEGYTVRGVQKLLRSKDGGGGQASEQAVEIAQAAQPPGHELPSSIDLGRLKTLRNQLASLVAD
jgi:DNA-binding transcriptional MerR regulator